MFNLLIRLDGHGTAWDDSSEYSLARDRVFWFTDHVPSISKYRENIQRCMELPCLFSYEDFNGYARIGRINSISENGNDINIAYTFDSRFPAIPIHDEETYRKLGCKDYEWGWTHWAVKDIELYEIVAELALKRLPDLKAREKIIDELWGRGSRRRARIFLSHRAQHRACVSKVARRLCELGHKTFVAHDDIEVTKEWRDEILRALDTMTHFVGLVTDDFHEGGWTDQEIGYAFARRKDVKKIFLRLSDVVPRGLANFEQAGASDWHKAASRIDELIK